MIKPDLHIELWDAFNDIMFDEPTHKYTDSKGTIYNSATGWIKQFEPDTDWDEIKRNKAKKYGIPLEVLTEEWNRKGDYATHLGTQCHSIMELIWQKKNYNFDESLNEKFSEMKADFEWRKENVCIPLFNKMKKIYVPIANEFIVYDQPNALCGTIDMLAYNKQKDFYSIIDWKTSKKFETDNRFEKYMKAPFEHVKYCNTAEYSLQLSLYAYILEKYTSIKIGEMILFQLPNKEIMCPQIFKCLDFRQNIADLLKK